MQLVTYGISGAITSLIGQLVLIAVVADFFTGFFHWAEDTYCTKGRLFQVCDENIDHHRQNGRDMVGSFVQRNVATSALFVFGTLIGLSTLMFGGFLHCWQWYAIVILASCGNEVHYINHMPRRNQNAFQRFLSGSGLIQSRHQHAQHHRKPYDRHYCVLMSFTNEVLELFRFWRILEGAIAIVTFGRVVPQRTLDSRDGF